MTTRAVLKAVLEKFSDSFETLTKNSRRIPAANSRFEEALSSARLTPEQTVILQKELQALLKEHRVVSYAMGFQLGIDSLHSGDLSLELGHTLATGFMKVANGIENEEGE